MIITACNSERKVFFNIFFQTLGIVEKEVFFVCSEEEFALSGKPSDATTSILIDTELAWFGEVGAPFTGFEFAIDLRRRFRIRTPIALFGVHDSIFFENLAQSIPKFNILFGSGTYVLKYPFSSLDSVKRILIDSPSISEAALYDLVTMLCDLRGIVIDKLNHELRFEDPARVQKAFDKVLPYLSPFETAKIDLVGHAQKLLSAISEKNKEIFFQQKEILLKLCAIYLTQTEAATLSFSEKQYTILVIDDREDELTYYRDLLQEQFKVITARDSETAIDILKNDVANLILAVISDWRLFTSDKSTYWQEKQGYEVLAFAAQSGYRALYALTSQADFVVHQIRNLLGVRFSMFKKDHLRTIDQWYLFKELLAEACAQMTELIAATPTGTGWTKAEPGKKSLNEQYLDKRNSTDWPTYEKAISTDCDRIWSYYERYIDNELTESLQDFSARFGYVLKNNLDNILIARRIAIGLYLNQGKIYQNILGENYPRIDVYSIFRNKFYSDVLEENQKKNLGDLKGKSIEEYTIDKMINASAGLLNTTLCLDLESLPAGKGMLPEEKAWVEQHGFSFSLQLEDEPDFSKNEKEEIPDPGPSSAELRKIEKDITQFFSDEEEEDDF